MDPVRMDGALVHTSMLVTLEVRQHLEILLAEEENQATAQNPQLSMSHCVCCQVHCHTRVVPLGAAVTGRCARSASGCCAERALPDVGAVVLCRVRFRQSSVATCGCQCSATRSFNAMGMWCGVLCGALGFWCRGMQPWLLFREMRCHQVLQTKTQFEDPQHAVDILISCLISCYLRAVIFSEKLHCWVTGLDLGETSPGAAADAPSKQGRQRLCFVGAKLRIVRTGVRHHATFESHFLVNFNHLYTEIDSKLTFDLHRQ